MTRTAHLPRRQATTLALGAALGLSALLANASAASAQLPGTIYGQVMDEKGKPVPNVKITITDPERPDFKQEESSDSRGRFRIRLNNATVPYEFALTKDGYQEARMGGVKVPARGEVRRNFDMLTTEAALAAAAASGAADPEAAKRGAAADVYNQGVMALRAQDYDTAVALFQSALEKQPELGAAHAALARVYMEKQEHAKALEHANHAIALQADVDSMNQVLYSSHNALGNKEEAQKALAALKAANPEKASLNVFNEAVDLYNAGNMAEAKAGFEQVLGADPNHAKAHYLLGLVFVNEANNAKAAEHLQKFIELAPDDPDAATAKEMLQYLKQ
jgi:tetratricopeptide (TPR) repeat protein